MKMAHSLTQQWDSTNNSGRGEEIHGGERAGGWVQQENIMGFETAG